MSEVRNIPRLRFPEFNDNWKQEKIKNLTTVKAGGTPSTVKKDYWGGNIPWMNSGELNLKRVYDVENRITDLGLKNSSTRLIPEKCILIGLAGQGKTRGTAAVNYIPLCTNQSIAAIYPNHIFNTEFLYQNIDNRYEELRRLSTGEGGRGGLNLSIIGGFEVPIPSLPEQQKIADFLTAVDKRIELLEKKKTLLETYKKGVMKKIFNQEIRFKDDNGIDFPNWEEKRLDEISKFRRGSFPQPYGLPEWYDDINGKPFVQVFDVGENFKLKPQTKQKISSLAEPKSVFVPKDSVVITIQGSIGRVAITQYDSYVDRTLLIFKELNGYLDKYFFVYQLYRLFEIEKRRAPGGTIKTITKEKLSSFTIQIPEKKEQLKISNFLFSIDKQLELLDTHIDKSKTWKKGLLQKMFV